MARSDFIGYGICMGDERRRHFRIRYPNLGRPVLSISGLDYPVSELSEGGVRIVGPIVDDHPPTISGTIKLLHGAELSITACFGRVSDGEAIYVDLEGVTFAAVMAEQRFLVKRYPARD